MNLEEFEGSQVLEKLAAVGLVDEFLEAVDSDDFGEAVLLMRRAEVDEETIRLVLNEMEDLDDIE